MFHSINHNGEIISVSDKWLKVLGYERDEVLGKKSIEFLTDASREYALNTVLPKFMETGSVEDVLYEFITKSGHIRHIQLSAHSEKNDKNEVMYSYAFLTDVSHIKDIETQLRASNETLGQMTHIAAYDLQSHLRNVSGFLKILKDNYIDDLNEKVLQYIDFSLNESVEVQDILTDILEYSEISTSPLKKRNFPLSLILEDTEKSLYRTLEEKRARIIINDMPEIQCDPFRLQSLFRNLIENSLKYCDKKPRIEIHAEEQPHQWLITVKDNGIGIKKKHQESIFEITTRLNKKKDEPGTGIGLTICKKIMEIHNGKIWVESISGHGSTFYLTFPK